MISPGLRIGRYEVGKRLGKGGFGVVHVARDLDLDRDVAIKVLRSEYAARPQIVQRFIKEARAAAKIGHPGIVTVFECSQIQNTGTRADGNAYIAMELLVGESLADRLLNGGRMARAQTLAITRQLAAALAAAHGAGIVHRDLKPDNVFLIPDAAVHGGERVKVLDFGVAKLVDGEDGVNTHSQMMLGTPKYMAPEQARSAAKADWRADIYTLGCMVFEMLTGRTPYAGDTGDQIIAHQKAPVPSARAVDESVPLPLDALVRRMLAKSPEDRPQTMQDIAEALSDLGDEPDTVVRTPIESSKRSSAEITTVAEPSTRRDPRPRVLAFGLGAALLSMLVVFVVMRRDPEPPPSPSPVVVVTVGIDAAVDAPVAAVPDAVTADNRLRLQCLEERDQRRWFELVTCAEQLRSLDKATGDALYKNAHEEMRAESMLRDLTAKLDDGALEPARATLDAISEDSVYKAEATKLYEDASRVAVERVTERLRRAKNCKEHARLLADFARTLPVDVLTVAGAAMPCGTAKVVEPPRDRPCDVDALIQRGTDALTSQDSRHATMYFELAYQCKPTVDALKRVFLMACKAKDLTRARALYTTADANTRRGMLSLCANNGVRPETFDSL